MPLYGNPDKQKVWYWFESKQELYVLLSHTSTAPFTFTLSLSNKEIRVSLFVLIPTNGCCYSYHWYLRSIGASAIVLRCSILWPSWIHLTGLHFACAPVFKFKFYQVVVHSKRCFPFLLMVILLDLSDK